MYVLGRVETYADGRQKRPTKLIEEGSDTISKGTDVLLVVESLLSGLPEKSNTRWLIK